MENVLWPSSTYTEISFRSKYILFGHMDPLGFTTIVITTPYSIRYLGRALGHFTFSVIGLKRILFTNIFQRL